MGIARQTRLMLRRIFLNEPRESGSWQGFADYVLESEGRALPELSGEQQVHSDSLRIAAAELGRPVEEITPLDLLDYKKEDLPDGPASPLGGEVPSLLTSRTESETRRLAEIGRQTVESLRRPESVQ